MLTNVHNYILREILKKGGQNPDDITPYLYNIAPDALPMHRDISPATTHKTEIPPSLLKKYPQLIYIKYHLIVDNLGHYNEMLIASDTRNNFMKNGYAYLKGRDIFPYLKKNQLIKDVEINDNDILYLSHILVEIALDYRLYQYDNSIARFFFEVTSCENKKILEEYYKALSELYSINIDIIKEARGEPAKFYRTPTSLDDFFLNRRSYLLLRKLRKDFTDKNVKYAVELIKFTSCYLDDYQSFLKFCVDKILASGDITELRIVADE